MIMLRPRWTARFALTAITLAALAFGPVGTASAAPEQYKVDPEHLSIGFLVDHIGYEKVLGMFRKASGSFTYDRETQALSSVRIVIETESVYTNHKRRDDHLRSPDFLNSDEFPEMVFTAGGLELIEGNSATLNGTLELLGRMNPVSLDVTLNKVGKYPFGHEKLTLGISARGSFKRSAYGMTYAVENGLVGDDVALIIELEAIKQ